MKTKILNSIRSKLKMGRKNGPLYPVVENQVHQFDIRQSAFFQKFNFEKKTENWCCYLLLWGILNEKILQAKIKSKMNIVLGTCWKALFDQKFWILIKLVNFIWKN